MDEEKNMRGCVTVKEWISGFSLWHVMSSGACSWCYPPIVVNDTLCLSLRVCVWLFSCFFETEKIAGLNLEQIKVYELQYWMKAALLSTLWLDRPLCGLASIQVDHHRLRPWVLTQSDSDHRRRQRSRCQRMQAFGRGSYRRCVDGKPQSPVRLKRFQLGTPGNALLQLDSGSAHKPEKKRKSLKSGKRGLKRKPSIPVAL